MVPEPTTKYFDLGLRLLASIAHSSADLLIGYLDLALYSHPVVLMLWIAFYLIHSLLVADIFISVH